MDNLPVKKNNEPSTVTSSKSLKASIMDITSDLKRLVTKMGKLLDKITTFDLHKDSIAHFDMEIMKTYILQSKEYIQNMATDMNKLIPGELNMQSDWSCGGVRGDETEQNSVPIDAISDVHRGNSDDDASLQDNEQTSKTLSAVECCNAGSELATRNETIEGSMVKPVQDTSKAELKLDTIYSTRPVSVTEWHRSEVKVCLKNLVFKCDLCEAVIQSGNDHMKEKHPDVKEFPCKECSKKFGDFESMSYHKLTHPLKKTKNRKQISKQHRTRNKPTLTSNLQCEECGKTMSTPRSLVIHKKVHTGEKPYLCTTCGKRFASNTSAQRCKHGNRARPVRRFLKESPLSQESCWVCGEILRNYHSLKVHLEQVHNVQTDSNYLCLICDEIFRFNVDLHNHLDLHSTDQHLKCKVCNKSFDDPFKLREHLLEHNKKFSCEICGKKYFKSRTCDVHRKVHLEQATCQVCGRIFQSQSKLEEHMKQHTREKLFECDVCHMKLFSASALQTHTRRRHLIQGGIKCYICGEKFRSTYTRNSHHLSAHTDEERRVHDVVVPMFRCDICGETVRAEFKTSHLKKHKSIHDKKRSICEICGKRFEYVSELSKHMFYAHDDKNNILAVLVDKANGATPDLHIGERAFVCHICGKAFKIRAHLKYHETIHSGTEPFRCDVCGKGFVEKQLLTKHYRVHTGEKPYTCQVCGLSFSLRENLKRHVKAVHNNERKFQCEFCNKRFAKQAALKIHRRVHTGEKPFSCSICGSRFADPSTLCKHKRLHEKK